MLPSLSNVLNSIRNRILRWRDAALGIWEKLTRTIDAIFDAVRDVATWAMQNLGGAIVYYISRMDQGGTGLSTRLRDAFNSVYNAIVKGARWARDTAGALTASLAEWVREKVARLENTILAVRDTLSSAITRIQSWIQDFPHTLQALLPAAMYAVMDRVGDVLDQYIDERWDD